MLISQKCVKGVYAGVRTSELDSLAAEIAAYLTTDHPDYSILAARIAVSNLHKMTVKTFSEVMNIVHDYIDVNSGRRCRMIADDIYEIIMRNKVCHISPLRSHFPPPPPLTQVCAGRTGLKHHLRS